MSLLINFEKYSEIHINCNTNLNSNPTIMAIIFIHLFTLFYFFKLKFLIFNIHILVKCCQELEPWIKKEIVLLLRLFT